MHEHVQHRVPVTALAFYGDNVILAGEGNLLRAYDVTTKQALASLRVFDGQAVHGILLGQAESQSVLVMGGSMIKYCHLLFNGEGSLELIPDCLRKATDWILDAALSNNEPDGRDGLVAFVTAHNALAIAEMTEFGLTKTLSRRTINVAMPGSNCLLYSAHVTWLSPSKCLIASGTAFGDIIVWSAIITREDGVFRADAQTHYTFSAHEGSVFGVQISPEHYGLEAGNNRRLLASCSDDRTIRVWDVSNISAKSPTLTQLQRDTGFGSGSATDQHAPPCIAKAMGHVSRIWQVRFLHHPTETHGQQDEAMHIMSFGEDASNISWTLRPHRPSAGDAPPYALKQESVQTAHSVKNIWSVAVAPHGGIATGGADGSIAMRASDYRATNTTEIECSPLGIENRQGKLRAYAFVDHGVLVASTDDSSLAMITVDAPGGANTSAVSSHLSGFRGYSVVASVPGLAFIAGTNGTVYLYNHLHAEVVELCNTGRKTAGLFACVTQENSNERGASLLVTSVGTSDALLLRVTPDVEPRTNGVFKVTQQWQLGLAQSFIVTSFAQTCHDGVVTVFLGARNGSIALYDINSKFAQSANLYSTYIHDAHAKEAVTALDWTQGRSPSHDDGFLHSTGRDGTHAVHRLHRIKDSWTFELVHQLSLPFGPNIEGLASLANNHLLVWGFRNKRFVAYDVTVQREIMSVECGGAHRNWAFQPRAEGGTFVWTKASRVYQHTQPNLRYHLINSGNHGREIKAVAVSHTSPQLIATGAEDTDIKISTFDEQDGFLCMQTLRKHITGIQHLQWSDDCRYLFSSGGFEEFFIWRITTGLPTIAVGVVCTSAHPSNGTSDLRIMGFQVTEECSAGVEVGTRFKIAMVYSDSTVKLWRYEAETWTLVAIGDYLTACVTQALCLNTGGYRLVTAATDGHLLVWGNSDEVGTLTWTKRHKVHQNAILGVASCKLSDGSHLFVTGGDDNAIGVTRSAKSGELRTLLLPHAHAAAVTGVAVVSSSSGRLLVASASIDQRLKLWQVDIDIGRTGVDGVNVKRLQDVFTAVADASSLELCRLGDGSIGLLVCGVGMDMWKVTTLLEVIG